MQVAVQPCSDAVAYQHYEDTIHSPVPLNRVLPLLSHEDAERVKAACGSNTAIWGVTVGDRGRNQKRWARLQPGDIALFYRKKRLFAQGRIVLTLQNKALAEDLWATDSAGDTWECIYFLDDLQEIEVSIEQYNHTLGYAPNNIIQGFEVHGEDRAEALLALLDLDPEEAHPITVVTDPEAIKKKLEELQHTDTSVSAKARREAGLFRDWLFRGKAVATCDLCGRELPTGFLVAAHIKPRASCSLEERRDPHVVMRACRLGCDEMFERRYLQVEPDGSVGMGTNWQNTTPDLKAYGGPLLGKVTPAFKPQTAAYFKWHREHLRTILKTR